MIAKSPAAAYLGALAALSSLALASPVADLKPTTPKCTDFIIPVKAKAPVKLINTGSIPANLDNPTVFEDFIVSEASSGLAALLGLLGTYETSGTFQMSARYCEPANVVAGRAKTIQYLQHAITYNKNYWYGDGYPVGYAGKKYSYVDVASSYGYPTIAVDTLGNGNSSHPDPVAVVQQSLQIEITHQIIQKLRSGQVGGPVKNKKFGKVIFAGHSYGSISGNGLVAIYPKDVDALVLTGYTGEFINGLVPLGSGAAIPAAVQNPARYDNLAPGYVAQSLPSGRVYGLFTVDGVGGYDTALPPHDFAVEGTVSVGELATLFYGLTPADKYTGSIFVLTGKNDAIVCNEPTGADCGEGATSKPAVAGKFFPNARSYVYHIPDKTGHDANLHYSSPKSFQLIHQYLTGQGF